VAKKPDGIVAVDYKLVYRLQGTALRAFLIKEEFSNWAEPKHSEGRDQSSVHYLGNRPQNEVCCGKVYLLYSAGEKWKIPCLCRGLVPQGTRKFGNLSPILTVKFDISSIERGSSVSRRILNTESKFYYFFEA